MEIVRVANENITIRASNIDMASPPFQGVWPTIKDHSITYIIIA